MLKYGQKDYNMGSRRIAGKKSICIDCVDYMLLKTYLLKSYCQSTEEADLEKDLRDPYFQRYLAQCAVKTTDYNPAIVDIPSAVVKSKFLN